MLVLGAAPQEDLYLETFNKQVLAVAPLDT